MNAPIQLSDTAPRYTSYPTAPHFHAGVTPATVAGWMDELPDGAVVSLYVHIPFCDRLCWFCACHTKQVLRYGPVATYLRVLRSEIGLVAGRIGDRVRIGALHFGGGSPTMLTPHDLTALVALMRNRFAFEPDASVSVEIDPNDMDETRLDALAEIGMTRASLGVQDFDPQVQRAINRMQSFEATRAVVDGVRARGISSVNLDLLYGLPHQTEASVADTVASALTLRPDRIALFGYAHVPWFKKHQTMIDPETLPNANARLEQASRAAAVVAAGGYVPIGLDHFALPGDSLAKAAAEGRLRRNFQGYTDDRCETLIGFGPSSVSSYRQGYAQAVTSTGEHARLVAAGSLPIARGVALSDDDRLRAWVIERLMCDFGFDGDALHDRFGAPADAVIAQANRIAAAEGLLRRDGGRFIVPRERQILVRSIAARFDSYLATGNARHSTTV